MYNLCKISDKKVKKYALKSHTFFAVMNIFHGIKTPIPCSTIMQNTMFNLKLHK